ncbi:uncharacterized protein LOC123307027 [Coccinella septempunctata]|uniref:uncharacterized protein LOC123307027 n=1 Tax=Coccinella septempunctata TaxID=41139 RepID=UPI001D0724ED|nr:uncharacterized protein LOC123307027 [Coccinella septempunctata]
MSRTKSEEEYTSDDGKRKRTTDDDDPFRRGKKLTRTPQKSKPNDEKMDRLMMMMEVLMNDIKEIKTNQREYQEEMKRMKEENEKSKRENQMLKIEVKNIKTRLDNMENEKRRNNVVVSGLKLVNTEQKSMKGEIKEFFKGNMDVEIEPKNINKIGPNICVIELEDKFDR